jgi:shikimate dehydrogenase
MALNFLSRLIGSFAMPAAENPTVAMVEAAYRHHRHDIRYINCEVPPENLADAVKGARAMGWIGFNCSIPHKVAVIEHLDGLGDSAMVIGAVNCAVRRGEKFIGENTEGKGFLQSLREVVDPEGKQVVMFGAGGAARAIGVELALAGATRIIVVTEADIVVNATSIGLYPDIDGRLNLDVESLRPSLIIADVIPNPPRTRLVRDAEARGCRVLDGLGMIVNQGIIGIKYWTGVDVEASVMRKELESLFAS